MVSLKKKKQEKKKEYPDLKYPYIPCVFHSHVAGKENIKRGNLTVALGFYN